MEQQCTSARSNNNAGVRFQRMATALHSRGNTAINSRVQLKRCTTRTRRTHAFSQQGAAATCAQMYSPGGTAIGAYSSPGQTMQCMTQQQMPQCSRSAEQRSVRRHRRFHSGAVRTKAICTPQEPTVRRATAARCCRVRVVGRRWVRGSMTRTIGARARRRSRRTGPPSPVGSCCNAQR